MTVKERLKYYAKTKEKSVRAFEINAGIGIGYINAIRVSIQPDKIQSIVSHYSDLNAGWLLTGDGEMLKPTKIEKKVTETEEVITSSENYKLVPLYNFDAVGGMNSYNDVADTTVYIEKYIPFIDARDEDICIPITGNSMIPAYPPGSLVLLREVVMWREYFGYGHVFVLALKDGRRIIKEVRKSEENSKENVLCVSYNASSAPEDLPKSMIDRVYKVVRILTNEGY